MSASLFHAPHPLVPLATLNVSDELPALQEFTGVDGESELALLGERLALPPGGGTTYSLFPSGNSTTSDMEGQEMPDGQTAPEFLGRLHQLKTMFRMSATQEPVSVMIHRVGPLLILDDGPCGWSRGTTDHRTDYGQPPPSLSSSAAGASPSPNAQQSADAESQVMLASLDPVLERALLRCPPSEQQSSLEGSALPELPPSELQPRLLVKNTFLDIADENVGDDEGAALGRTYSAPGRMEDVPVPVSPAVVEALWNEVENEGPHEHNAPAASWSLIPYQPEACDTASQIGDLVGQNLASSLHSRQADLLQLASSRKVPPSCSTLEAVKELFSGIPPQPSRFGRAFEWRCGPHKILLGCDLVVFRADDQVEPSNCASFKMLPPGGPSEPSREERLDVYLENLMCDIQKVVWGSHHKDQTSWRVFNTSDLPSAQSPGDEAFFDPELVVEQGKRLLHFLRQQCSKQGGTYWLFREQNSPVAELFDLSRSTEPSADDGEARKAPGRALGGTSPSLALPIASLCFHLAKSMPYSTDQRQLLQKGLHLLEPVKEENAAMYSMVALQLACSYMKTPLAAIPDVASAEQNPSGSIPEPPAAACLAVALRYLEGIHRLLSSVTDATLDEMALQAELLLQAHVAYCECIVKLVRDALIPTYTSWLTEVQRASQELSRPVQAMELGEMKRLSAAFLLWRLFWLCRAQQALNFVPQEKRDTECWILERDLCETMGDAFYGLSRYRADDVDDLLSGHMATSEGICMLVQEALRQWGLRGATSAREVGATQQPPLQKPKKKRGKRLTSPGTSPQRSPDDGQCEGQPYNMTAMFLSKLNPLDRGVGDEALLSDPLLRDDQRRALWTEGRAYKRSLSLFERAAARLLRVRSTGDDDGSSGSRGRSFEEQATMKVARKLAHLYNEEARAALIQLEGCGTDKVEELLRQAHQWMLLSGDFSNASRVLLNLSELHARKAESLTAAGTDKEPAFFTESQYMLWVKAIQCCGEAVELSEKTLGLREYAFAHLRVGVHLSVRVPIQSRLLEAFRREEMLAELADRHFGKALCAFDEMHDEREVAVCHFHMADLALQEQKIAGATPMSKARITSALRHARRSADYWEREGMLQYAKDFLSANVRIARLLEHQQKANATVEAVEHLAQVESRLLELAQKGNQREVNLLAADTANLFIRDSANCIVAVTALRREMSRACQAGIRQGCDVERLKTLYRRVLRNEPLSCEASAGT